MLRLHFISKFSHIRKMCRMGEKKKDIKGADEELRLFHMNVGFQSFQASI